MSEITKLYRYVRGSREFNTIYLDEYSIVKETPKGYRISVHTKGDRLVLKEGRKRFAHETPELALESFILRTQKCLKIQQGLADLTKGFLHTAIKLKETWDLQVKK